jgi:DNA-directed RNA polymerase specialized sigma24 family protein
MSARTDQIAALYEQQARLVQRQVARRVNAPAAVIEDACQTAWERLCTHPDVDAVAPGAVKGF